MSREADLINHAIKAGRLTVCPPAEAAGEHNRAKKKRKGERPRPCPRCNAIIRFIKGTWKAGNKRRKGWHWTNANGSHHRCGDFR